MYLFSVVFTIYDSLAANSLDSRLIESHLHPKVFLNSSSVMSEPPLPTAVCPAGHTLIKNGDPYNNGSKWKCDGCGTSRDGAIAFHCDTCKYDLDVTCVEGQFGGNERG
jgi:hypothetical protein